MRPSQTASARYRDFLFVGYLKLHVDLNGKADLARRDGHGVGHARSRRWTGGGYVYALALVGLVTNMITI